MYSTDRKTALELGVGWEKAGYFPPIIFPEQEPKTTQSYAPAFPEE
jgi:hypothetical protein